MTQPRSTGSTPKEAHLGFGSLHFQVTSAAPDIFSGSEYLGWVESELRRLPSASVIEVSAFEDEYLNARWLAPDDSDQPYIDCGIPYPPIQFCRLKFAVEIPLQVQAELLNSQIIRGAGSTDFIVSIQDGWQMPTAMVWPADATSPGDGSTAVQVVREYLRREVGLGRVAPISFDCLGPSPAHFTIQLQEGTSDQLSPFHLVRREPTSYPNYVLAYKTDFVSLAAAVDELQFELLSQLDSIYRIAAARVSQLEGWDAAETGARRVLSAYEARGPRGFARRLAQGRNIGRVQIALVGVELNQTLDHKRLSREVDAEYADTPGVSIEQVLRDQMQGFETFDVEPLSKLLEALASARQTGRAVLIAAVASLIGAAVAAVATLLASSPS